MIAECLFWCIGAASAGPAAAAEVKEEKKEVKKEEEAAADVDMGGLFGDDYWWSWLLTC